MKKNKIVALIVLGIILLQIVIPSLADIDWNVVFAEEINTWDISQNGDGSVMATLSDDGTLTISGNGEMKHWNSMFVVAWDSNRKNIKNVIINNGVTSIGNFAFHGCENLINITIPDSVTSIGLCAFKFCRSLTSINVDSNNEKYMSDKGVLYTKDKKSLIQYPCKKEGTEYIILQGVTSIGNYAFEYCRSLTNITIPNSVTSIGNSAFYKCTSLTSITIPNSVTSIGNSAFSDCTSLIGISVDSNNEKYMSDKGVLYTKDKKSLIQYPCKKEGTEYIILQGVTSIGNYAFEYCRSLTNITIPNSVTSIGNSAFYKCTSLTSITIPNSVTSIGGYAFESCSSLTSITIPNGVTSVGGYAFYCCTNLTNITIPNSVTSIGYGAFKDCTSLTSITIPNSVTSIGQEVFSDCRSLTNITIPNSVTSIGGYAFESCRSLTSITIPNSVTSIGDHAFYDCESLTSINVDSNNEKYMSDNGVLYTKDKKTLIKYPSKKDGTKYIIMQGVASIGDNAFEFCSSLTSITIPDSVTSIGDDAFYKCDSLSVLCKSNSYAEQYAKENNIKYVIDDSVPTIKNVTGNEKWTKDKVTLTISAEDSLSGLATEAYSFDNGQTWQKENTKTYTENTQGIIIKVRDAVGNVATYKTIDINNILKIEISNYEKITKDNNEYLTKIEANTTIAQLKEKIKTNGTIKVLKGNNEITDTNTLVGTGMQIQIETERYIAIVKADLNGDGKIGLSDLSNIKFSLIGKKQLSTEAQIAGDINGDGKVSLSDMAKLKMYLVGKANI